MTLLERKPLLFFLLTPTCEQAILTVSPIIFSAFCNKISKITLYLIHCCKILIRLMRRRFFSLHADFLGFSASVLCALHCAAIPLLLTAGAFSGVAWLENEWVEFLFIGSAILFASWSLIKAFFQHQQIVPLLLVVVGFSLILWNHFGHGVEEVHRHGGMADALRAIIGGILIATAHYVNWRYTTACAACRYS